MSNPQSKPSEEMPPGIGAADSAASPDANALESAPAALAEGFRLPTAGEEFDKYTLLAKLATGGMAELFVAELSGAAGFSKKVVIKRILPHVAHDEHFIRMFLDEAITCAQINHPNVCQVFELCESQGTHFLVLEHLEGATVGELIRRCLVSDQQLNMHLAAGIIVQACDGLHAAHEQTDESGRNSNLVHRDVSPGNLFVTVDGIVKVLDFGIAKARWMSRKTKTGTLLGKCEYMSPEQARGGVPLDRRSDIFSLGIIAWELVVGQRLFRRESEYETLRAVLRAPIERPRDLRPSVPPALDEAIMRALERDPGDRHRNAYEFRQAIADALRDSGGPTPMCDIAPLIRSSFAEELRIQRAVLRQATKAAESQPKPVASLSPVLVANDDENFANTDVLTSEHKRLPSLDTESEEADSVDLTFNTVPGEVGGALLPEEEAATTIDEAGLAPAFEERPPSEPPTDERTTDAEVESAAKPQNGATEGAAVPSPPPPERAKRTPGNSRPKRSSNERAAAKSPARTTAAVSTPLVVEPTAPVAERSRLGLAIGVIAILGAGAGAGAYVYSQSKNEAAPKAHVSEAPEVAAKPAAPALPTKADDRVTSAAANAAAQAELLAANTQARAVVTALPAAEANHGEIQISSSVPAKVYLYPEKTLLGTTPLSHSLPAGKYKLKLEIGPTRPERKYFTLTVDAGKTATRNFASWPSK